MLILVLLIFTLYLVYLLLKYVRVKSSLHPLPPAAPGKQPIIGHGYQLFKYFSDLWEYFTRIAEHCAQQGGVTHFKFGNELYYLITDPQDALTAANACIKKHYAYDLSKPWFGDGVIISSGDIWKRHRKLMTPAFTLPVIHGFLDVFNSQSKKLASSMELHVGKRSFDHSFYVQDNSFETFCVGTLGINPIDDEEILRKYMESAYTLLNMLITRAIKVWLQNDFIFRLVGMKKKQDELLKTLHSLVDKILQDKKEALKVAAIKNRDTALDSTGIKYKPILDLLLELSRNGSMTDNEVREETDAIIAAGFETTSTQLTYTLLLLGTYPEVQEKVYRELLEVLGADRDVEKDDVNKLVYTNAVLLESLRVFPTVPLSIRYVAEDLKLKNYTMRAGSHCVLAPLVTHLDPAWGAESDKFRPERWLDGDLRNNKEFAAFGLGKRACLGRTYVMILMKVTLAHFLRQYRVKADISKLKVKFEFVLKPVSGHEISIERRT